MPTPTRGPRLGGSPAHERLLLANLATALFEHGRITTTVAKAKRLRPLAERLITSAKRGDIHARRQVLTVVRDKSVVHTLFAEIGPRFAARPGGYTRITKIGPRKGDNAPMAQIELVEALTVAQQAVGEAERSRGSRFARDQRPAQVPVPTEGGDTEVVTEPAAPPAESTSPVDDTPATATPAAAVAAPDAAPAAEPSAEPAVESEPVDTEATDTEAESAPDRPEQD